MEKGGSSHGVRTSESGKVGVICMTSCGRVCGSGSRSTLI